MREATSRQPLQVAALLLMAAGAAAAQSPAPDSYWPMIVGAQYTYVLQHQDALHAAYSGPLSLGPGADTQATHTMGLYAGWAPVSWAQLYFDTEKFMGAGVSGTTGLGGLTNGDVVRQGANGLKKTFYIARSFVRFMLPLGSEVAAVERAQDQLPGKEDARRLELKAGRMAVNDDFDKNRYAGSTRTEFMNWSLWDNTAWDYAANTRGYTDGIVIGYVTPEWSLKYGIYRMPEAANGQALVSSLQQARGENLELTVSPWASGTVVRVLAYRNTAAMGNYREALAIAAATAMPPSIVADDREGRHKTGFGINVEQPLADEGETGVFLRLGWNDGRNESFAFTEVDNQASVGAQVSGVHWRRPDDRLGSALVSEGLSGPHRDYLEAGGAGFLLGDGRLHYGREEILEVYYRAQLPQSSARFPVKVQLSPDFQYIRNPGYNQERGPARFIGVRLHLEY
ncbi:MAG: porin [Gammaproteobacteria bacterium]|nr:porin [Gammaproteobacteria bacterium]